MTDFETFFLLYVKLTGYLAVISTVIQRNRPRNIENTKSETTSILTAVI